MSNIFAYIVSFFTLPAIIFGLLGLILGWVFWGRNKQAGDLSIEGEGQLRAEADSLRTRVNELEGDVSSRDSEISDLKAATATEGTAAATGGNDDETYALEWRNRYLAARVKYLEGRVTGGTKTKKKPATKKRVAKKMVKKPAAKKTVAKKPAVKKAVKAKAAKVKPTKKAPAKKAVAKKATTKKSVVKKVPAKKAAPKPSKAKADPNAKYLAEVRKYDPKASKAVVNNIVKYCGISLRSRDASLVACSDEKELNTVAKGFCTKKLGMTKGQMDCVKDVCGQMKAQRFKNRVTFYYLCAKQARKMKVFR